MLAALLLALAPVQADSSTIPDYSQHVEVLRPRMAPRALTPDELRGRDAALAQLRAASTLEALVALQPFAETGDKAAMRAMMDGYVRLAAASAERDKALGTPILERAEHRLSALAGLWAKELWQAGVKDHAIALALNHCVFVHGVRFPRGKPGAPITYAATSNYVDCGFDVTISSNDVSWLYSYAYGAKPSKGSLKLAFADRPVFAPARVDRPRLEWFIGRLEERMKTSMGHIWDDDMDWANEVATRNPEYGARFFPVAYRYWMSNAWLEMPAPPRHRGFWAWVRADAARDKTMMDALAAPRIKREAEARRRIEDEERFDQRIASRSYHKANDKYWMSQVAIRGGERARQWFAIWGNELTGYDPSLFQWCQAGVGAACAQMDSYRSSPISTGTSAGSGYTFTTPDSSRLSNHLSSVNRANCARALMGANIACSLP